MVLSPLQLHVEPIVEPALICPQLIGWRAQFYRAVRLATVAQVGATELQLLPQSGRPPLAPQTVLQFWDYGWPYLDVVLPDGLAADATVATVEPLRAHLYPTARAAVGPYSLEGATLSGSVLETRDGPQIATFAPRCVGDPADGVLDAEFDLSALPSFWEPCDDPPYWLRVVVNFAGEETILFLGQTQNDVAVVTDSDRLVRFAILPGLDPNHIVGNGAIQLPALVSSGVVSLGEITFATGAVLLPALLLNGQAQIVVSGDGSISLPSVTVSGAINLLNNATGAVLLPQIVLTGTASIAVSGDGAAALPGAVLDATASIAVSGDGSVLLGSPELAGAGNLQVNGSGAVSLPTILLSGTATVETVGIVPLLIPSAF